VTTPSSIAHELIPHRTWQYAKHKATSEVKNIMSLTLTAVSLSLPWLVLHGGLAGQHQMHSLPGSPLVCQMRLSTVAFFAQKLRQFCVFRIQTMDQWVGFYTPLVWGSLAAAQLAAQFHHQSACRNNQWIHTIHTTDTVGSIDGFHSIFSLGNWRALHHHAPCWMVNIHITWPFCPPVSVMKDAMKSIDIYARSNGTQ